jgi:serine phosphatase RsbU (regulator of sigma subunit)
VAVLGALVALDLALPGDLTLLPLFVAIPVLIGLERHGTLRPLCAGGLTLVGVAASAAKHWTAQPTLWASTVVGVVAVTVCLRASARSWERRESALQDLREVAETMQRVLLRPVPRRVGSVRTEVRYLAAAAQARVGGDLYDVVSTPFGVRVIIGDVMGKGLLAVERAADVVGAFRELAQNEEKLPGAALRLDAFLARLDASGEFVTGLLIGLPKGESTAELVCCGHPPPLILRDGQATFLEALSPTPPLGIMRLAGGECQSDTFSFGPGDRLLLYTDGVSEARDGQGRFYPLAERATALFRHDPVSYLEALEADLLEHVGGHLDDDAALLLVQPDVPAPGCGTPGAGCAPAERRA